MKVLLDRYLCSGRSYRDLSQVSRKQSSYYYLIGTKDNDAYSLELLTKNYRQARSFLAEKTELKIGDLISVHKILCLDKPNRFRLENENAWVGGKSFEESKYKGINGNKIESEVLRLLKYINDSTKSHQEKAIYAYVKLCCVHPFLDGNGRVARALFDFYWFQQEGRYINPLMLRMTKGHDKYVEIFDRGLDLEKENLMELNFWKDSIEWSGKIDKLLSNVIMDFKAFIVGVYGCFDESFIEFVFDSPVFDSLGVEEHPSGVKFLKYLEVGLNKNIISVKASKDRPDYVFFSADFVFDLAKKIDGIIKNN